MFQKIQNWFLTPCPMRSPLFPHDHLRLLPLPSLFVVSMHTTSNPLHACNSFFDGCRTPTTLNFSNDPNRSEHLLGIVFFLHRWRLVSIAGSVYLRKNTNELFASVDKMVSKMIRFSLFSLTRPFAVFKIYMTKVEPKKKKETKKCQWVSAVSILYIYWIEGERENQGVHIHYRQT